MLLDTRIVTYVCLPLLHDFLSVPSLNPALHAHVNVAPLEIHLCAQPAWSHGFTVHFFKVISYAKSDL